MHICILYFFTVYLSFLSMQRCYTISTKREQSLREAWSADVDIMQKCLGRVGGNILYYTLHLLMASRNIFGKKHEKVRQGKHWRPFLACLVVALT